MFTLKKLFVPKHTDEVHELLKNKLRLYPPYGHVSENSFKLYSSPKARDRFYTAHFVFTGVFEKAKNGTVISYRMRPTAPVALCYCILPFLFIYILIRTLLSTCSPWFLIIFAALNILQIIVIFMSAKEHICDFENYFKQ